METREIRLSISEDIALFKENYNVSWRDCILLGLLKLSEKDLFSFKRDQLLLIAGRRKHEWLSSMADTKPCASDSTSNTNNVLNFSTNEVLPENTFHDRSQKTLKELFG